MQHKPPNQASDSCPNCGASARRLGKWLYCDACEDVDGGLVASEENSESIAGMEIEDSSESEGSNAQRDDSRDAVDDSGEDTASLDNASASEDASPIPPALPGDAADNSLIHSEGAPPALSDGLTIESKEASRQSNWTRYSASGLVSAVVHLALLLLLALVALSAEQRQNLLLVASALESGDELESLQAIEVETDFESQPLDEPDEAFAEPDPTADVKLEPLLKLEDPVAPDVELPLGSPAPNDGASAVESTSRAVATVEQAVDGIVDELKQRRQQGDLLVLWLFDASNSLKKERVNAATYLGPVLRSLEGDEDSQLRYAAYAYGAGFKELISVTGDGDRLIRMVKRVPEDPSGRENLVSAIGGTVTDVRKTWKGPIMAIVWTDESGDDLRHVEQAIRFCRRERVSVTIVGSQGGFGRHTGQQLFAAKGRSFFLPVNLGRETALPQRAHLPGVRHDGPFSVYHPRPELVDAGFGPYPLVRLTRATGGRYLIFNRAKQRHAFNPTSLARYEPDYRSEIEIEDEMRYLPLRQAVVSASEATEDLNTARLPRTYFFNKNGQIPLMTPAAFQGRFRATLTEERGYVQSISGKIEQALEILSAPGLDQEYEREKSPRWRAAFDLMKVELLRASVEYREYDLLCGELLQKGLKPTTNYITFGRGGALRSGAWGTERLEQANLHTRNCRSQHSNTPWARLSRGLARPGYRYSERIVKPAIGPRRVGGSISLPRL